MRTEVMALLTPSLEMDKLYRANENAQCKDR
jgi:hypothetical protein